ncbi:SDR family oxidoreductase [Haladaptatus sp. T7]|uniref:SDR family oxidoreductase n=1 Tax=Haladaptatus sp. T7 TaxID=2029368 RepID=UPI0021A250CF|nr:SDR family oxidoreductase [Haladaptatus sp. T7]GKZ16392.1 retinol dehydrogenase [Haladaptatus sp. T7]
MPSNSKLDGQVALITGGTSGIGRETALALADRGASVAIVGRNRKRGRRVAREIDARNGDGWAELYIADFASRKSVRNLAVAFRDRHDRLDVLVNNAGTFRHRRSETGDGIEATFAVNHLAPFLLTHLLVDTLVESAPARVVTVTSELHERGTIDFSDLGRERDYDGMEAYSQSKLANVLFTRELAERLRGTGVTATAVNPGFVPGTGFTREASIRNRLLLGLFSVLPLPFTKNVEEGAETVIEAAASPEFSDVTGEYVSDGVIAEASDEAHDDDVRRRLWDVSAGLVDISPDYPR